MRHSLLVQKLASLTTVFMAALAIFATGCASSTANLPPTHRPVIRSSTPALPIQLCVCKDCSDAQYDQCIAQAQRFGSVAVERKCADEFSDYLLCMSESIELGYHLSCTEQEQVLVQCFGQTTVYASLQSF